MNKQTLNFCVSFRESRINVHSVWQRSTFIFFLCVNSVTILMNFIYFHFISDGVQYLLSLLFLQLRAIGNKVQFPDVNLWEPQTDLLKHPFRPMNDHSFWEVGECTYLNIICILPIFQMCLIWFDVLIWYICILQNDHHLNLAHSSIVTHNSVLCWEHLRCGLLATFKYVIEYY